MRAGLSSCDQREKQESEADTNSVLLSMQRIRGTIPHKKPEQRSLLDLSGRDY